MWASLTAARPSEELRGRLRWFLFGRVILISCFLGGVALLYLRSGEERYAVSVNALLAIIIVTYVFSIFSALLLRSVRRLVAFTQIQIGYDILLITALIYSTGGVHSPFAFLYSLPIISSAALLFSGRALVTALAACGAYVTLALGLAFHLIPHGHFIPGDDFDLQVGMRFATTNLTFFLIAYLAGILTRRLHTVESRMLEHEAERDRLSILQATLARTIGSGLITTDAEGNITTADEPVEQVIGRPTSEILGQDIGTVFPPLQLAPRARARFLQSTGALEPVEFSHQVNGSDTELRCAAAPLRNTYGHPIGALYVLQDITRLKQLEQGDRAIAETESAWREDLDTATEIAETADGLYGTSPAARRLREMIRRVAGSDTTVLITGESGTGKELVARAIHANGARADKPFIAINCGAIPESLIESELFGHVRGAFTGAVADRAGCFRAADKGTIFLDEIGDLPVQMQVKLLRVLQERVFRPVGSETTVAVNVRVIAATNRDLQTELQQGRFREDLFYRLNVITIDIPPLREHRDDIPLLVRHFLRQFSKQHGRQVSRFSVGASRLLLQHPYPGNIRELENVIEHSVALCDGDTATEEHLPAYILSRANDPSDGTPETVATATTRAASPSAATFAGQSVDLDADLAAYEKTVILHALEQAGGVKKRAAEILGINYRSLRHRLQKYGINGSADEPD